MTESIGILGTGEMGGSLAQAFSRAGHPVLLGSRDAARAAERATALAVAGGGAIQPGDYATTIQSASILILALGFSDAFTLLPTLGAALNGKLVVDISTPWGDEIAERSAAERLADQLPATAQLVGAWKTTFAATLDGSHEIQHDVFVSGDHAAAKQRIGGLIQQLGFRAVDCGNLATARVLEGMVRLMGPITRSFAPTGHQSSPAWKFLP